MIRVTDAAIRDIFTNDLLVKDRVTLKDFTKPSPEVIKKLLAASRDHRKEHYRFMQSGDYKDNFDPETATDEEWEGRAKSLLFLSKREQELANLLTIRMSLNEHLGDAIVPVGVGSNRPVTCPCSVNSYSAPRAERHVQR